MNKAIATAIDQLGTQQALARALRRSQGTVSRILNAKTPLPKKLCLPLEKATKGKVPRWVSRPDLYKRSHKKKAKVNGKRRTARKTVSRHTRPRKNPEKARTDETVAASS